MCKICGRLVPAGEDVKMGGTVHTVCSSCRQKEIPMMAVAPGRYKG